MNRLRIVLAQEEDHVVLSSSATTGETVSAPIGETVVSPHFGPLG